MSYAIQIPVGNPIRLICYDINDNYTNEYLSAPPDWVDFYPNIDNMQLATKYFKGIEPFNFMPDWQVGEELKLQIRSEVYSQLDVYRIYKVTESGLTFVSNLTKTNITPAGWIGYDVSELKYTITEEGYYQIRLEYEEFGVEDSIFYRIYSDVFYVTNTLATDKNLIKIQYKNSYNNLGMVWNDYYTMFISGLITPKNSESEKSVMENSTGFELLRTVNRRRQQLTIASQSSLYITLYEDVFGCDDILVNGDEWNAKEGLDPQETQGSDLIDINIMLTKPNNNSFRKIL